MNGKSQLRVAPSISGHVFDLGVGHSIAIYERNGTGWVAEFRDGHGEVMQAGAWFRFHAGGLRAARGAFQSATPLTADMLDRIERLHRESEAREEKMLAVPRSFVASAMRYWANVILRLRGGATRISQTVS